MIGPVYVMDITANDDPHKVLARAYFNENVGFVTVYDAEGFDEWDASKRTVLAEASYDSEAHYEDYQELLKNGKDENGEPLTDSEAFDRAYADEWMARQVAEALDEALEGDEEWTTKIDRRQRRNMVRGTLMAVVDDHIEWVAPYAD